MKFEVNSIKFLKIIQDLSKIINITKYENVLSCIHIRYKDENLEFVVTDGNVLVIKQLEHVLTNENESDKVKDFSVNFHINNLKNINIMKSKKNSIFYYDLMLIINEKSLFIKDRVNETSFSCKAYDKKNIYPQFDSLFDSKIQKKNKITLCVDKELLKKALDCHDKNNRNNSVIITLFGDSAKKGINCETKNIFIYDSVEKYDSKTKTLLMPVQIKL